MSSGVSKETQGHREGIQPLVSEVLETGMTSMASLPSDPRSTKSSSGISLYPGGGGRLSGS